MKFRILLRSFDNDLINLACQQLRSTLTKTECKVSGVVSLPTKIKRFCVLRSPHVDKDSREHFEIKIHKKFLDIYTVEDAASFLNLLQMPTGAFFEILPVVTTMEANEITGPPIEQEGTLRYYDKQRRLRA